MAKYSFSVVTATIGIFCSLPFVPSQSENIYAEITPKNTSIFRRSKNGIRFRDCLTKVKHKKPIKNFFIQY